MKSNLARTGRTSLRLIALFVALCCALCCTLWCTPDANAVNIKVARAAGGYKVTVTDKNKGTSVTGVVSRIKRENGSIKSANVNVTASTDSLVPVGQYRVVFTTKNGKKSWSLHRLSSGTSASPGNSDDSDESFDPAATVSGDMTFTKDSHGNVTGIGATITDSAGKRTETTEYSMDVTVLDDEGNSEGDISLDVATNSQDEDEDDEAAAAAETGGNAVTRGVRALVVTAQKDMGVVAAVAAGVVLVIAVVVMLIVSGVQRNRRKNLSLSAQQAQ